jgi:hypothetical protein
MRVLYNSRVFTTNELQQLMSVGGTPIFRGSAEIPTPLPDISTIHNDGQLSLAEPAYRRLSTYYTLCS